MAAEVTESLPNLKMSTPPKMVDALKATHTVLKAIWRQKPDFVMKRTDAIYPVLTFNRLTAEFRSSLMSRLPILSVSGAAGAEAISCRDIFRRCSVDRGRDQRTFFRRSVSGRAIAPDSLWNTAIAGVVSLRHSCGVSDQPSPSDEENVFQLSAVSRVQRPMAMKSPGVESTPKMRQKMQSISRRGGFSWIWWVVLLALLGGGAWAFWFLRKKEDAPKYLTAPAKRMDITSKVTATGTLSAVVSVQVGSQISGNILKLLADFNTPVKAGQVVAELDPATFQANVHLADGDLATAQAGKELAELTSKRTGELFSQRLVAQAERDKAVADLHQAEAVVAVKHAALERAKIDLARCTIVAPVDGIVISRNVDVGQTVAAAMTAPVLFTIANDLTKMHIEANVSEADIGGVQEGQEATFLVDAFPDRAFHGKIVQVRYAPITVDNVVTYVTVIELENPKKELRPGMTANVSIVIAERKNVIAVPNAALRFRPIVDAGGEAKKAAPPAGARNADGSGPKKPGGVTRKVYRLEGSTLKPIEVTLGVTDGINTEVLTGLNGDEKLATGVVTSKPAAAGATPFGGAPGGGPPRRF
jgi:HlyD family secretion protein